MLPNDLIHRFTTHLNEALQKALGFAVQNGRELVEPGDLLVGLLAEKGAIGAELLKKVGCKAEAAADFFRGQPTQKKSVVALDLSDRTKKIVEKCIVIAHLREHKFVGTEHLVASLLETDDVLITEFFLNQKVDVPNLREQVEAVLKSESNFPDVDQMSERSKEDEEYPRTLLEGQDPARMGNAPKNLGRTPIQSALDAFARELTHPDIAPKLDPVIGRESELDRMIQILIRRTKSNPILLGEPGVGKTAIVEGLAQRLASGDVPDALRGRRLLSLDLASTVAGTMYRGEFEARLKQIVEEARQDSNVILFIDEIHNIVGAGSTSGSLDAANILKPALARGEIHCIGATTWAEYKKHIEPDAALERRFQPIFIEEPTAEKTLEMIKGLEPRYAEHHGVTFHPDTLRAAVDLSERFMTDRLFPDKAVDLLDEAAAAVVARRQSKEQMERLAVLEAAIKGKIDQSKAHLKEHSLELAEEATNDAERLLTERTALEKTLAEARKKDRLVIVPEDVAQVVARVSHVPLSVILASERARLSGLEDRLRLRIFGQEEALSATADVIRRARLGLQSPNRPKASLLFIGPSGTGKTELARAMAQELFGREDALVKLDMSEFSESHSVSKLVGSPAGYVGYRETTKLTDAVRKRPHCVVCFDEIEKAHQDVQQTLLQMLEDGQITDATGKPASLRNTYVVLTSNVGSDKLGRKTIGYGDDMSKADSLLNEEVKQRFRPELLNRLDRVVLFRPLDRDHLRRILDRELLEVCKRLEQVQKVACDVSESARDWLMNQPIATEEGARAVRRLVEKYVTSGLSRHLITNQKASRVRLTAVRDGIKFR